MSNDYSVDNIGSISWYFGGGQSFSLALNNSGMDATVIYYGSLVPDIETLSAIQWHVLGIFAELDNCISVETVSEFESTLNELDMENQIFIYSGVDHAFANPSGA